MEQKQIYIFRKIQIATEDIIYYNTKNKPLSDQTLSTLKKHYIKEIEKQLRKLKKEQLKNKHE